MKFGSCWGANWVCGLMKGTSSSFMFLIAVEVAHNAIEALSLRREEGGRRGGGGIEGGSYPPKILFARVFSVRVCARIGRNGMDGQWRTGRQDFICEGVGCM